MISIVCKLLLLSTVTTSIYPKTFPTGTLNLEQELAAATLRLAIQNVQPMAIELQKEHSVAPLLVPHLPEFANNMALYQQAQLAHQIWHNNNHDLQRYTGLSPHQIAQELAASIYVMRHSGQPNLDASRFILDKHHLYGLPAFVENIKTLPEYPQYLRSLYQKVQSEKGPSLLYWFNHRYDYLPPGFACKVDNVEKLYKDLVREEQQFAQQQSQLVQRLMTDYKTELPYQDAARTVRIQAREKILHKSTSGLPITRNYRLSNSAQKLLLDSNYSSLIFTQCTGTELQQRLHTELVDIVNQTAELSTHPAIGNSPISVSTILSFSDISAEFNNHGEVAKGFAVADLSWAMLDYTKAALEGATEGLGYAVEDFWHHPIEAGLTIIAHEYVLAYQLCKVLHEVGKISLRGTVNNIITQFNPEEGTKRWVAFLEPITQTIDALSKQDMPLRNSIKTGAKLGVGVATQSKLLGSMNTLHSGLKKGATRFLKKNPLATPEQYMLTPEGIVFRAAKDASNNKNLKDPTAACIKGATHTMRPVPFIKNGKELVRDISIPQSSPGIIKTFEVPKSNFDHMFSEEHKIGGILNLGKNKLTILDTCIDIVLRSDQRGLLKVNSNQIHTTINGLEATIRVHIVDGKVMSLNAFAGHATRKIGNTFNF